MNNERDQDCWRSQVREDLARLILTIQSRCTERTTFFASVIEASVNTLLTDASAPRVLSEGRG